MRVMGAGVELEYVERGEGPATVFAHGMGADARAWPLDAVPGRAIAYDRRGYGASEAPDPYVRTTVNEQAEDLACVVRRLDAAPALLVGRDVGALAVLDVLLRHAGLARAAVLVDPPLYQFVPEATEALSAERAALEDALRRGGPVEAVRERIGAEPTAGEARAFFADFGALATLELTRGQLRGIAVPLGIVTSPGAPAYVRDAAAALERLAPRAHAFASLEEALAG